MNGVSTEWLETREDELAHLISSTEQVDKLRQLARMLRERDMITHAYYLDMLDTLDFVATGILIGKRNTAALRNGRIP